MLKKVLSITLALTLALALSLPAMAADPVATGGTTTGEGNTEYLDTEIYAVWYPTDASFDYTLDPQGLLSIEDGDSVNLSDLKGGKILSAPVATSGTLLNESSVPVKITAKITAISTVGTAGTTANFVTATSAVTADTANNIALLVAPSTVDMGDADAEFSPTADGFAVTETPVELEFALPEAIYKVTNTGGVKTINLDEGTGHGTAMKVCGYVNENANWANFDSNNPARTTLGIQVLWEMVKDANANTYDPAMDFSETGAFGLLVAADGEIRMPSGLAPTVAPDVDVTWTSLTANGSAGATTTSELYFVFSEDLTGLAKGDISVTGTGATVTVDDLQKTATGKYTATISGTWTDATSLTVAVDAPDGFALDKASDTVTVHKAPAAPIKGADANVTMAGSITTIKLTATNFTFPNNTVATYTIVAKNGAGTDVTIAASAITNMTLTGSSSVLQFSLVAGWAPGGAQDGFTDFTVSWPSGQTVKFTRTSKSAVGDFTCTVS